MDTWKRAQNLQVVSRDEGAALGRLDDFQFDLDSHRIYGWSIKGSGVFGRSGGVAADELLLIGRDVAFVTATSAVEWGMATGNKADGRAWASAYRGTPAMTRRGESLGGVQDYVLDQTGRAVTALILQGDLLLALDERVATGPAAVIVAERSAVVALPGGGDGEPAWWERLRDAVGVRGKSAPKLESSEPPVGAGAGAEAEDEG